MRNSILLAVVLLSLCFQDRSVLAANISIEYPTPPKPPVLVVRGEIVEGDYAQALTEIAADATRTGGRFLLDGRSVILKSKGGSLREAGRLARLFKDIYARVLVIDECFSACFLLIAGAPHRILAAGLTGLHSPYFDPNASAGMTVEQLEARLRQMEVETKALLNEFAIPSRLIERMWSRTSTEIYILTLQDYLDIGRYSAIWNQIRVSKCGARSEYERTSEERAYSGATIKPEEISERIAYGAAIRKCEDSILADTVRKAVIRHIEALDGKR